MTWSNIRPGPLRAGDRVHIVAPAGPVPAQLLDAGIAELTAWGLRVSVAEHVRSTHPTLPYLAGADVDRAADLCQAWCDPDIDAVLCARGGYGCLRMLDLLDWTAMAGARPKLFAGSSDITALHHAFGTRLGLPTLLSPMPATRTFVEDSIARERFRAQLFAPESAPVITSDEAGPVVSGVASGPTFGGNASLLCSLLGAADAVPPPTGSILLLEDVTEEPYRLDRIISQLRRGGWLDSVAGVGLGSWTDCGDPAQVRATLTDLLGDLDVPVAWGLGFGHCPAQATVPLGVPAILDADAGTLTVSSTALI